MRSNVVAPCTLCPPLHAGTASVSDWVLDLVATGFNKPQHLFGNTLRTIEDVDRLATAFLSRRTKVQLLLSLQYYCLVSEPGVKCGGVKCGSSSTSAQCVWWWYAVVDAAHCFIRSTVITVVSQFL